MRFLKTCRALMLWPLLAGLLPLPAAEQAPSYAEWTAACAKLPTNRVLRGRVAPADRLPLKTFAELNRVLDEFISLSLGAPLGVASNWVGVVPAKDAFFNPKKAWFLEPGIPFEPFAGKLELPAGSRVVLQGDLHGDIHSLLAVLERLNRKGWLDGFKIVAGDVHLMFLGDYTDRGMHGIEVLYTLLRLKLANPDRVHFCRGNHEEVSLVARYGFLAEGQAKYGRTFDAAKILRAYDFIPVVTYLGRGNDFLQVNHGGMEPGYRPGRLLAAPGDTRFQLLGELRQGEYLRSHPGWISQGGAAAEAAGRYYLDFTPTAPTTPSVVGFMWNDFTVFGDEPAFDVDPGRAFVYGQSAVVDILEAAGSGSFRVRAVIRAHQHSGIPNPLMRRLIAGRGVFRHWQEPTMRGAADLEPAALAKVVDRSETRSIPDGSVWTFNVAPDSVYGIGCNFGFVTFGILHLTGPFDDWKLEVESFELP